MCSRDGFSLVIDHKAFYDVIEPSKTDPYIRRLIRLLNYGVKLEQKKYWIDPWQPSLV